MAAAGMPGFQSALNEPMHQAGAPPHPSQQFVHAGETPGGPAALSGARKGKRSRKRRKGALSNSAAGAAHESAHVQGASSSQAKVSGQAAKGDSGRMQHAEGVRAHELSATHRDSGVHPLAGQRHAHTAPHGHDQIDHGQAPKGLLAAHEQQQAMQTSSGGDHGASHPSSHVLGAPYIAHTVQPPWTLSSSKPPQPNGRSSHATAQEPLAAAVAAPPGLPAPDSLTAVQLTDWVLDDLQSVLGTPAVPDDGVLLSLIFEDDVKVCVNVRALLQLMPHPRYSLKQVASLLPTCLALFGPVSGQQQKQMQKGPFFDVNFLPHEVKVKVQQQPVGVWAHREARQAAALSRVGELLEDLRRVVLCGTAAPEWCLLEYQVPSPQHTQQTAAPRKRPRMQGQRHPFIKLGSATEGGGQLANSQVQAGISAGQEQLSDVKVGAGPVGRTGPREATKAIHQPKASAQNAVPAADAAAVSVPGLQQLPSMRGEASVTAGSLYVALEERAFREARAAWREANAHGIHAYRSAILSLVACDKSSVKHRVQFGGTRQFALLIPHTLIRRVAPSFLDEELKMLRVCAALNVLCKTPGPAGDVHAQPQERRDAMNTSESNSSEGESNSEGGEGGDDAGGT